uniref:Metalloendopeptidase n=1 Tax=Angiostrongylus cantonensis TaxID=6313 RepID=A0A0K0D206_ANGCA
LTTPGARARATYISEHIIHMQSDWYTEFLTQLKHQPANFLRTEWLWSTSQDAGRVLDESEETSFFPFANTPRQIFQEGSAVHEIGHVLGLFHTMQRHDRDDFIKVVMENVDPLCIKEFEKVMVSYIDVYGLTYDYGSVMHYSDLRYSRNNRPTMITIDPNHQRTMGSELISFSDIFMVNEHYGCNSSVCDQLAVELYISGKKRSSLEKCNNRTSVKCENEGFPHPRNCST